VTDLNERTNKMIADEIRAVFLDIELQIDQIDGVFVHVLYKDGGNNTWQGGNPGKYTDVIVSVLRGVLLRILPENMTGGAVDIPDLPQNKETEDDQDD